MIIIIISFIDNLALFYLSLDGTLFPDELLFGTGEALQFTYSESK